MTLLIRPARLVCLMLFVLGGFLSRAHKIAAFEPGQDFWFIETLTPSDVDLPEGISIRTSEKEASPRASLILENHTDRLLYILSLGYKDVLVMVTPDPGWESRVKLAHEVASFQVSSVRPLYLGMEALVDLDHALTDRNRLSFEPPAENVSIPERQASELLLVYGDRVILVPFKLSYALNPHFDTGTEAHEYWMANVQATNDAGATATAQAEALAKRAARNQSLIIGLAVLAVVLITSWLVWSRFLHHR